MVKHSPGIIIVHRLAHGLTFKHHCAVGPDDQSRLHCCSHGQGLLRGQSPHHINRSFSGNWLFSQVGRHDRELQTQDIHQLAPPRRR